MFICFFIIICFHSGFFTHKETNGWQKRWTLWSVIWQDAALSNVRTFLVAKCAGLITWWLSRWKIKLLPSSREFLRGFAVTESGHVPPVSRTGFSVTSLPLSFRTLNNTKVYVTTDWLLTYWLQRAFQHGRPIVCASPPSPERPRCVVKGRLLVCFGKQELLFDKWLRPFGSKQLLLWTLFSSQALEVQECWISTYTPLKLGLNKQEDIQAGSHSGFACQHQTISINTCSVVNQIDNSHWFSISSLCFIKLICSPNPNPNP